MFAAKQLFSIVALSAVLTIAFAQAHYGCSRNGSVQIDDTCDIYSLRDEVPTFQLTHANPVIDALCDNIYPGELLCMGLWGNDCMTIIPVKSGDSCSSIATAAMIPLSTLLTNNPNINADCSNLYPGEVLCVDSKIYNYD
jgi:hypothetical protein